MKSRVLVVVAFPGIVACAASNAPPPETVSRVTSPSGVGVEMHNAPGTFARTVSAPIDSVWQVLPRVFEILGVSEAAGDEEMRTYGALDFRPKRIEEKRLSTYIDCGMGVTAVPNADAYQVTMDLLTRLRAGNDGGTTVETSVHATARPRAVTGNPVYCQSNGVLESRVADLVLWVLVSGR